MSEIVQELIDEARRESWLEWKLEGKIEYLLDEGYSVEQIAKKLNIPEDKVEDIISNIGESYL